jgi:hypothetical protein
MGGSGSKKKKEKKKDDLLHLSYGRFPSFYLKKKQMNNPTQPIPDSYVKSYWYEDAKKIFQDSSSTLSHMSFQNINQNPLPMQSIPVYPQPTYIYPPRQFINVSYYNPIQKPFNQTIYHTNNNNNIQRGILIREEIIPMIPIRKVTKKESRYKRSETTETTATTATTATKATKATKSESKSELKKSSSIKQLLKKSLSKNTISKSFSKNAISKSDTNETIKTDSDRTIHLESEKNFLKNESKSNIKDNSLSKSRSRTRSIISSLKKN